MVKFLFILVTSITSSLYGFYEWDCYERYWLNSEYLYWQIQAAPKIIPLVVEGPFVPNGFSMLDQTNSQVILGGKKGESRWHSGAKFSLGFWGCELCAGVEFNYLFLSNSSFKKSVASDNLFFSIPFINSITRQESSILIAEPGIFDGFAALKVSNSFQGAEINSILRPCCCYNEETFELFGGIRYINFAEKLIFNTNRLNIHPAINNKFFTVDRIRVENHFYGGQIGLTVRNRWNALDIKLKTQLAFGAICHATHLKGDFYTNDFTGFTFVQHFNGGYFVLPSMSRHRNQVRFSVVPDVDFNVGYQIVSGLRLYAGYNFIFIANVVRPSHQLDRKFNPTGSPLYQLSPLPLSGTRSHKKNLKLINMWIQGMNLGFEWIF